MRLFYAALALEANTFLPIPTSYQAFVEKLITRRQRIRQPVRPQTGGAAARAAAKRNGFELIEGPATRRSTAARLSENAYDACVTNPRAVEAALPVEGCLFNLHGAMVAHGYDDCEGDSSNACARSSGRWPLSVSNSTLTAI